MTDPTGPQPRRLLRQAIAAGAVLLLGAACFLAPPAPAQETPARRAEPNTRVPEGDRRHAAGRYPDRIAASPAQDASTGFAVAWRTGADVAAPVLEIAPAADSPDIGGAGARRIAADTRSLTSRNGVSHHHRAEVGGLAADTLYAWRVQGGGTWSPWFQYRTAPAADAPVALLYFGDTQNQNASLVTRVVREARRHAPDARLALFAGDLVSGGGAGMDADDDEWGEWFEAASGLPEDIAVAPAAGNHEFHQEHEDTPREKRVLSPHWSRSFALPRNGAPGVEATSYWFDFGPARVAVLDGTSILDLGAGPAQAAWLRRVFADAGGRWRIVQVHQPLFALREGRDDVALREQLSPVLREAKVDLVLQGHDHAYGRRALDPGKTTPLLLASVAGAKQYRVSRQALETMAPVAEDTQLFQLIRIDGDALRYEARTASGRLYDAFALQAGADGARRLLERTEGRIAPRRCMREASPKGRSDRCWE